MTKIYTLLVLMLASQSFASECVISSTDFPNSNCSFNPPFEVEKLKFGNLDSVFNSGESIRIGTSRFNLIEDVEIFDASEADCEYDKDELEDDDEDQEIAFKVSETNSREITHIWLLDCTVELAR
ncbi:MAG: hypothetical protein R8G33_09480 [Gammaproteobacteria bacterium]|nr:hypothetical protein [Gammaproteobacteria bacterium]